MTDAEVSEENVSGSDKDHVIPLKFGLVIDVGFAKSIEGILLALIAVLSFIAFCCVASARIEYCDKHFGGSTYNFFEFVSISCFIAFTILYVLYLTTLHTKLFFQMIPWLLIDLGSCGVYVVLYFISSIVLATKTCYDSGNRAGAAFGFFAMFAICGKGYFSFRTWWDARQKAGKDARSKEPDYDPDKY